jgi:hypothetical protein
VTAFGKSFCSFDSNLLGRKNFRSDKRFRDSSYPAGVTRDPTTPREAELFGDSVGILNVSERTNQELGSWAGFGIIVSQPLRRFETVGGSIGGQRFGMRKPQMNELANDSIDIITIPSGAASNCNYSDTLTPGKGFSLGLSRTAQQSSINSLTLFANLPNFRCHTLETATFRESVAKILGRRPLG